MRKLGLVLAFLLIAALAVGTVRGHAQDRAKPAESDFLAEYKAPELLGQEDNAATFLATLFKFSLTLVVVIALIYLTVFVLKMVVSRYRAADLPEIGALRLLDSLFLGPNKVIHLVSINNKRLLVISAIEKEIHFLDKIEDEQKINDIVAGLEEKWKKTHLFKEDLKIAKRKRIVQESLSRYIKNLTNLFRSLKTRS